MTRSRSTRSAPCWREAATPRQPLAIGSVKTNIGHLEAAAGIAGVVKTVLALQRREIPPHLHFNTPNPYIDWASLPITVPTSAHAVDGDRRPRLAGVSSFGFSGTNAHVILEEAPVQPAIEANLGPPATCCWRCRRATRRLWRNGSRIRGDNSRDRSAPPLADVCFTANAGRSHFARRVAVNGTSAAELDAALARVAAAGAASGVGDGQRRCGARRASRSCFRARVRSTSAWAARCTRVRRPSAPASTPVATVLDPLLPQPLRTVIFAPAATVTALDDTAYAQPAMFAVEIALAALWRSWGIEPVAVMGHSFGEYAAACVAGAISLADAARMVAARGRLAQALPRDGAMTVVEADEREVSAAIVRHGGRVAIAAVNGATNTVISGERRAVDAIAGEFAATGARVKALRVSHAFHSPLIEPVLDAFEAEIAGVEFEEPRLALVSNLSGRLADRAVIGGPGYWRRQMREPVRFADSMRALAAQGITHYIEMSPHPVLLGMGSECVSGGQWLPSLREGKDEWAAMFESLQTLYCSGADVDWAGLDRGLARRRVALPTYPFQRRRHWIDLARSGPVDRQRRTLEAAVRHARPSGGPRARRSGRGLVPGEVGVPGAIDDGACGRDAARGRPLRSGRRAPHGRRGAGTGRNRCDLPQPDSALARRALSPKVCSSRTATASGRVQPLPDPDLAALWTEAERLLADNRPLLDYVRHCGTLVADVLRGRESPLETLVSRWFVRTGAGAVRAIGDDALHQPACRRGVRAAGRRHAARPPVACARGRGRHRRHQRLSAASPAAGTHTYRFTDVSDAFLERARQRFGAQPDVEFGLFDLDAELEPQGLSPGQLRRDRRRQCRACRRRICAPLCVACTSCSRRAAC